MTSAQLRGRFEPKVYAGLDWDLLVQGEWEVVIRPIENKPELSAVELPWYLDADGGRVNYDVPGARRVVGSAVLSDLDGLWGDRRANIEYQRREFATAGAAVFPLICFRYDQTRIAIDGCHRVCAALAGVVPVRISCHEIIGTPDPLLLPDLLVPPQI